MLEVELKARVDDLGAVRERLHTMRAVFECAVTERDLYLNSPARDFAKTDEALRLREAGGHYTLTYKGSRKTGHPLKAREEIICGIESGETMEKILVALGFRPVAEVRKRREYYHVRDATVTLDSVEGLGEFVEIELDSHAGVPASYLIDLAASLGVTGKPIQDSYLELLEKSRKKG
ncbi:MAG TPA: class IV adenylate cyclase [Methanolinea sp.]|nr:class IV adenylate cyclase [Methanolinea sp.]